MAKMTQEEKAQSNIALYNAANDSQRQTWQAKQQKGYDFYLGDQISEDDLKSLKSAGMPTFTINRIMPIIEIMKFFATANNPKWVGVGVEGSDINVAAVHSTIAEYIWRLSKGQTLYSSVILDALTKSVGYFHVKTDPNLDMGMGEVLIENPSPWEVYVDKKSRDALYRDANFIQIRKTFTRGQLLRELPQYKTKIKKATSNSSFGERTYSDRDREESDSIQSEDIVDALTVEGEQEDILDYYYTYYKTCEKFWNVFIKIMPSPTELVNIREGAQKQIQRMAEELMVKQEESITQIQRALAEGQMIDERAELEIKKIEEQTLQAIEFETKNIMKMAEESASSTEHKVVNDKQYKILLKNMDIARQIINANSFYQPRINVRCSVSDKFLFERMLNPKIAEYPIIPVPYIHTGTPFSMSASTPLVGKQEEINKAHQITIHNANLSGSLRWLIQDGAVDDDEWDNYSSSPGARLKYRQGYEKPDAIHPTPLNNAFFSLVQEGKVDLEYMSGIYSSMQGDVKAQHETIRGLLQQDEYGTRRIRAWMDHIVNPALEHLGKVVQQFAQSTYTSNKVFRLVNPNNVKDIESVEINMLYPDKTGAIQKAMDYETTQFDVYLEAGSGPPVNRWALVAAYESWFEKGAIDDIAFLEVTDIENKEAIVKRKSLYSQQRDAIQQLEKVLKDKEGTIETLERQIVQSRIKGTSKDVEVEIHKKKLDTQAQLKLLKDSVVRLEKEFKENIKKDLKNTNNEK